MKGRVCDGGVRGGGGCYVRKVSTFPILGGAPDSAASGSESASATAGERRSWSANNALPPLARGSAGGNGSPRTQLRPLLSVKPPSETTNGIAPG